MATPSERATAYLHDMLNEDARFRPGQLDAILAVAENRGRVLLVQRTGWGKSAVYFIATKLLRDEGAGPTLLVSPLLALMRNQMQMAERLGVRAETINSTTPDQFEPILDRLRGDEIDLLLVSPERFANERFTEQMLPLVSGRVGLLVIDEAHCISDWGHDFRPDYRRLVRVIELLPRGVPVLCTTATANDRVIADVSEQLGEELVTLRGALDRESLELAAVDMPSQVDRLAWLAQTIPKLDGSGIVYVLTVADSERVAQFLQQHGISAEAYSGGTDAEIRPGLEQQLLDNDLKVLVATSALGMGFDKPDLGFVIHFQSPGSPIAYYQQVGRAGRALERAPAILLHGTEDRDIQDYFIETAFPTKSQARDVIGVLAESAAPMSLAQIEAEVNIRRGRLSQMLKILEVEGAVQREGSRYLRTLVPWEYPAERVERITELRRHEQEAMDAYVRYEGCLMEFLRRELDDPDASRCGRCSGCTGEPLDLSAEADLQASALEFLRGSALMLEPRLQWPSGVNGVKGRISEEECLQVGRVLCVLSDGGWGGLVRRGRYDNEHFDDA